MYDDEEWEELLDTLITSAYSKYCKSAEHERQKQGYEQLDEYLSTNLTAEQKTHIEELLDEFSVAMGSKAEALYRQGIKDCVWLLKNLGVLA